MTYISGPLPVGGAASALEYASPVQTKADLKAVDDRADKQGRYVEDAGAVYFFDQQSVAADDGDLVLAPDAGTGRWLKISGMGSGDVTGPGSATDGAVALYDGTTGKLIKDGPVPGAANGLAELDGSGDVPVAQLPAATTTTQGAVELATDGEAAAGVVVQGNDARLSDSRAPSGAAGGELSGTYPNPTVDDGADGTAIHDDTAAEITAITAKAIPVGADTFLLEDSAAGDAKKSATLTALTNANNLFIHSVGRNNANTTDIWLRDADAIPLNTSPIRLPFACTLIGISATGNAAQTWDAEVFSGAIVRTGGVPLDASKDAELQVAAANSADVAVSVAYAAGTEIGVFLRGTSIDYPSVDLYFVRTS